jgi:hypothetical protein
LIAIIRQFHLAAWATPMQHRAATCNHSAQSAAELGSLDTRAYMPGGLSSEFVTGFSSACNMCRKSLANFRRANPAIEINMRKLAPMDQHPNAVPEIGHRATRCGGERPQTCTALFAIA